MAKFPEAERRTIQNLYVCKKCKSKIRTTSMRVLDGKVRCRKCGYPNLRPVRKK